jgi:DNA-binding transcriptional LysR family regulator
LGIYLDKLEALQIFSAIAESGGFAAAARRLRTPPQSATRAIAGLESELGVQLLQRTTRSVRLTEQGAAYLASCRRTLAELRAAEDLIKGTLTEPQGTLVITAPVVFGRIHVVPIVTALLRRNPRLAVRLALIDRSIDLVEEGIDVAVRIGDLADSTLRAIEVGTVRYVLVASPAYLSARGMPASPKDLHRHELILFTGASANDEWRIGSGGQRGMRIRPRMSVNSADAAISAAEAGFGITRVLSYQVTAAVAAGRLQRVLDDAGPPPVPVTLLFQAGRSASANVRSFIDRAKEYFRSQTL